MTTSSKANSDGKRPAVRDIVRSALAQFAELSGQEPDRVSGVRKADSGWSVLVDVVDLERVPATTSVLSTYRVDVDADGELTGYERIRRFTRSSIDGR
jgi:hypothetical protein